MQVERSDHLRLYQWRSDSGERVSNTLVTYPEVGHSSPKGEVIPDMSQDESRKTLRERPRPYQLVGEVTAHQGDDG